LLNRSLLVDGVNEIFVVTTRISLVTFLLTIYCAKEFFSEINKEYFLKGTLTGFLAITIPGWTFIYALKSISSGLQSIFISTIPMFTVFWVFLVYKEEKITRLKVISVFIGLSGLILLFASGATGLSSDGDLVTGGTYLLAQWIASTAFSLILFFILGGEVEILNRSQALRLSGLVFIDIFNYSLFFYTIKRLSATFTTLVDYVVPIVGIYVGYVFLDEVINNIFFVTLFFIFISLYLAVKDEARSLD